MMAFVRGCAPAMGLTRTRGLDAALDAGPQQQPPRRPLQPVQQQRRPLQPVQQLQPQQQQQHEAEFSPLGPASRGLAAPTAAALDRAYAGQAAAPSYSPQDSPVGANVAAGAAGGQVSSFGFSQEQVACVCEVRAALCLPTLSLSVSLYSVLCRAARGGRRGSPAVFWSPPAGRSVAARQRRTGFARAAGG